MTPHEHRYQKKIYPLTRCRGVSHAEEAVPYQLVVVL